MRSKQLIFDFAKKDILLSKKPSKKKHNDLIFDLLDPFHSPIITYPSAWKDLLPDEMLKNVTTERLKMAFKKTELSSLLEVLLYMKPRTHDSPLPHDWVEIYTWCGLQYAKLYRDKDAVLTMEDIAPQNLNSYQKQILNKLRAWIFTKRREALKKSFKTSNLKTK